MAHSCRGIDRAPLCLWAVAPPWASPSVLCRLGVCNTCLGLQIKLSAPPEVISSVLTGPAKLPRVPASGRGARARCPFINTNSTVLA
eukprot:scaffold106014_cov67-Phaeocystis_antarctica.AAC.2